MKTKHMQDADPRTSNFGNSTPDQIALYGYQSKPASLLQGIHFNATALHCPLVLLGNQRVPTAVRIPLSTAQIPRLTAPSLRYHTSNLPNDKNPYVHDDKAPPQEIFTRPDNPTIDSDLSDLDDEDTVQSILVPNLAMSSGNHYAPDTPPPDETITGTLAFTLPPAAGFPAIQGWTKLGTAINLSNMVEHSRESLSEPKCLVYTANPSFPGNQITQITDSLTEAISGITGNNSICLSPPVLTRGAAKNEREMQAGVEPFLYCLSNITTAQRDRLVSQQCWSTDVATFFVIPFHPKPLTYIATIHKLTHPDTEAGARGVTGVVQMAMQNSPEVLAFITGNRDALSSSLSPEQALNAIVNSVNVRKMDLIGAGGQKERTWAVYATSPTSMFNIYIAWRNLIVSLPFDADLATHGEGVQYHKHLQCMLCYGIDHPTPLCPYPLTPGWRSPVPRSATRNNAPTIDFDALQVLDIHHTPARETRPDRGRGMRGGGRGNRGFRGHRGSRGLNYGPY
ncbi:hypothetical protein EDD85DRAFT_837523 [Armillaria nabsnona]|nr:hypothetical protein EDD85DRAFT_837523 [Armillaria nabsnona]